MKQSMRHFIRIEGSKGRKGCYGGNLFWLIVIHTQQVKGFYETKNQKLMEYLKAIQELTEHFVEWNIIHILRTENTKVNGLAKMVTSLTLLSDQEVIYQVDLALVHQSVHLPLDQPGCMSTFLEYMRRGSTCEPDLSNIDEDKILPW